MQLCQHNLFLKMRSISEDSIKADKTEKDARLFCCINAIKSLGTFSIQWFLLLSQGSTLQSCTKYRSKGSRCRQNNKRQFTADQPDNPYIVSGPELNNDRCTTDERKKRRLWLQEWKKMLTPLLTHNQSAHTWIEPRLAPAAPAEIQSIYGQHKRKPRNFSMLAIHCFELKPHTHA